MKGGDAWYCTRCHYKELVNGEVVEPVDEPAPKQWKQSGREFIESLPTEVPHTIRSIPPKVRASFGVRVGFDEATGDPSLVAYPMGDGVWKVRKLPKTFFSVGKGEFQLFGKPLCSGSGPLIITGGEEDAMAAKAMLLRAGSRNIPDIVSLPNGESSLKAVSADMDWIKRHSKVLICLDMDEPGREGTAKLAALLDMPCAVVELPLKDANEMLEAEKHREFVAALNEAKPYQPSGIVHITDIMDRAMERTEWGTSFPWPSLTKVTYGMRPGDGYYIGAGVKCGKSEWLNELAVHLIRQGKKPFLIKAEEVVHLTARKLAGKLAGKIYHRPDIPVDDNEVRHHLRQLADQVILYNRDNSLEWDEVKQAIRHAVIVEGCEFIFIDPITCLTDGMEASDANRFLQQFSRELDQMAKDLGFTYFCFCHLNNPKTGPEHNRGGAVLSSQFAGSRAMSRACTYMIGLERNKDPELDIVEQNTTYCVLLEDRNNGNTTRFPILYDRDTGVYAEPDVAF